MFQIHKRFVYDLNVGASDSSSSSSSDISTISHLAFPLCESNYAWIIIKRMQSHPWHAHHRISDGKRIVCIIEQRTWNTRHRMHAPTELLYPLSPHNYHQMIHFIHKFIQNRIGFFVHSTLVWCFRFLSRTSFWRVGHYQRMLWLHLLSDFNRKTDWIFLAKESSALFFL